jgi:PTH1 family peptidyl-tRNA hydrolase
MSEPQPTIRLVVGLGNPGKEYERTRHNIGFMALDELARRHRAEFHRKLRFNALVTEIKISPIPPFPHSPIYSALLAKPQTFMNNSGASVHALAAWHKLSPQELLVVVDDADLPLGTLRLREGGSGGGQKGLTSVIQHLGAQDFPRLRIGIGRPAADRPNQDLADHVLSTFDKSETPLVKETVTRAADAIECALQLGITKAMNEFNKKTA